MTFPRIALITASLILAFLVAVTVLGAEKAAQAERDRIEQEHRQHQSERAELARQCALAFPGAIQQQAKCMEGLPG